MKTVDLSTAHKDEIQTKEGLPIHGIAWRGNDSYDYPYLVTFGNGDYASFTREGRRYINSTTNNIQFKPKTETWVKPLHKILAENPDYQISQTFIVFPSLDSARLYLDALQFLGSPLTTCLSGWHKSFLEEKQVQP